MNFSKTLVDHVGNLHLLFVYSHKCQAGKRNTMIQAKKKKKLMSKRRE